MLCIKNKMLFRTVFCYYVRRISSSCTAFKSNFCLLSCYFYSYPVYCMLCLSFWRRRRRRRRRWRWRRSAWCCCFVCIIFPLKKSKLIQKTHELTDGKDFYSHQFIQVYCKKKNISIHYKKHNHTHTHTFTHPLSMCFIDLKGRIINLHQDQLGCICN